MIIEKGRTKVEDTIDKIIEKDGNIVCGCGNKEFEITMHLDGTDFYQTNYKCKCGNQIQVITKRDENDYMGGVLDDD